MQYKAATDRDARRRRHEQYLQYYQPQILHNSLRTKQGWRNIAVTEALSEGREVPDWQIYVKPSDYDWEFYTNNGSKEFLADLLDYVESGRALADGIDEDICSRILRA